MSREKYGVSSIRAGKGTARVTVRARILLKTDEGWSAPHPSPGCGRARCFGSRRFAEEGLEGVLPGPKPIGTGSWTTGAKPTSLWPAPNR